MKATGSESTAAAVAEASRGRMNTPPLSRPVLVLIVNTTNSLLSSVRSVWVLKLHFFNPGLLRGGWLRGPRAADVQRLWPADGHLYPAAHAHVPAREQRDAASEHSAEARPAGGDGVLPPWRDRRQVPTVMCRNCRSDQ